MAFDWGAAGSGALSGAAAGSAFGPVGTVVGGVVGLAPSLFKLFSGNSQLSQANKLNPNNPGYQINNQVLDNARILGDRYNNYRLPGYTQQQGNIDNTYQNAYSQGIQGATSGGDVADLAAKLAYGKNIAENNLAAQNAVGKDAALQPYLEANAAAGRELQGKNAYDRDIYQQQLREKAALTQAGNTNIYNGLDNGTSVLSAYLNPRATTTDFTSNNIGKGKNLGSIFESGNPYQSTSVAGQGSFKGYPTLSDGSIDFGKIYQRYNSGQ